MNPLTTDESEDLEELLKVMSPSVALETLTLLRAELMKKVAEADRLIALLQGGTL